MSVARQNKHIYMFIMIIRNYAKAEVTARELVLARSGPRRLPVVKSKQW